MASQSARAPATSSTAAPASSAQAAASSPKREKLDVETPEERQERLGRLFTSHSSSSSSPDGASDPFLAGRPDIGHLPQSDLLARVRNFLPLLASSNEDLLQRAKENPSAVDIENTAGQDKVIEMDLGLGVFDVQGAAKGDMGPELDIPEDQEGAEEEEDDDGEEDEDEDEDEDMEDSSETDSSSSDSDSSPSTADSTPQPPR